jgi:hypothetical protein
MGFITTWDIDKALEKIVEEISKGDNLFRYPDKVTLEKDKHNYIIASEAHCCNGVHNDYDYYKIVIVPKKEGEPNNCIINFIPSYTSTPEEERELEEKLKELYFKDENENDKTKI